ncbi:hypothetical protein ACFXTI_014694 [Malus domestica]
MGRIVMQYKPLVEYLKFTLDCLRPRDIREIGKLNVELGLPKDEIERLQQQIEEGSKLVDNFCKCSKPSYTDRLLELNSSLRELFELLKLQEAREMKAILLLNTKIHKRQLKLATRQSKLLKRERDILRAPQEAKGVQELSGSNTQTVVQEQIGGSGLKQAAPIKGGGAALEAVFEVLFSAVIQTKEKTRVFKRILGHLESTLYSIKPLIEEIAEYNQVLHLTEEELETFRVEMEKGVELVHKCSKISLRESNKKYEYTNKLFRLNDPLQRLINRQKVQLARDARECLVSVTNMETGVGKMTKSRKLKEGAKKVEGSGVVQNQTEIQASNMVSMEESEIEFEPQQVCSSEFGT